MAITPALAFTLSSFLAQSCGLVGLRDPGQKTRMQQSLFLKPPAWQTPVGPPAWALRGEFDESQEQSSYLSRLAMADSGDFRGIFQSSFIMGSAGNW
jgi:hypothetical protein